MAGGKALKMPNLSLFSSLFVFLTTGKDTVVIVRRLRRRCRGMNVLNLKWVITNGGFCGLK